jgi:hypothetical protein
MLLLLLLLQRPPCNAAAAAAQRPPAISLSMITFISSACPFDCSCRTTAITCP